MFENKLSAILVLLRAAVVSANNEFFNDFTAYSPQIATQALGYSKISYCDISKIPSWTCSACEALPQTSSAHVLTVSDSSTFSVLAYDAELDAVVLTFRGTEPANLRNWMTNIDAIPEAYPDARCEGGCQMHPGFYGAWKEQMAGGVLQPLDELLRSTTNNKILVTGHSLGGALATFAALHLATEYHSREQLQVSLYTFGSPRIGNFPFVRYVAKSIPISFRITHDEDPVVQLPPPLFDYTHLPNEVFYEHIDGTGMILCQGPTAAPGVFSEATREDFETPECASRYGFRPLSLADHLYYLGDCTNCTCAGTFFEPARFCWKDAYTRRLGRLPQECGAGQERFGLLCYDVCPPNMERHPITGSCRSTCPQGDFYDDGIYCKLREQTYDRPGYWWSSSCRNDHGTCEKCFTKSYPKCRANYHSTWYCSACERDPINCPALNLDDALFSSGCKKRSIAAIFQNPRWPSCGSDEEYSAGLCYQKCSGGDMGIGLVCWSGAPEGWVDCGFGAARTPEDCASAVDEQTTAAVELLTFFLVPGVSLAATYEEKQTKFFELLRVFKKLIDQGIIENNDLELLGEQGYMLATLVNNLDGMEQDDLTEAEIVRYVATLAEAFDPTGISGVLAAYSYDKCSVLDN